GAPGARGADLRDPRLRRRPAPGPTGDRPGAVLRGPAGHDLPALDRVRRLQPLRQRHRYGPRPGDRRLPVQPPRGRRPHPAAPPARLAAGAAVNGAGTDLAWLGVQAAARLPREVHLRADGRFAVSVDAEISRLRGLAD